MWGEMRDLGRGSRESRVGWEGCPMNDAGLYAAASTTSADVRICVSTACACLLTSITEV